MPTIYFHGNYDRYEEHNNCSTEQILSYKTQFFNSVTIISWVLSPAIDKSLQCHAFNYLHQQRWPTVTVTTDETHHPLPHCAHIHWLVSTASVSVNGCHFFLHGRIQWHTCFIHTAMSDAILPDCPAAAVCHMARKCNGILVGSSASIAIHQCPPLMPWASKIKQEALLSEQPSYFPFLFGLAARQTLDRLNQKRTVTENPFQQPIFKLPTPSKTQKVPRALQFFYFQFHIQPPESTTFTTDDFSTAFTLGVLKEGSQALLWCNTILEAFRKPTCNQKSILAPDWTLLRKQPAAES